MKAEGAPGADNREVGICLVALGRARRQARLEGARAEGKAMDQTASRDQMVSILQAVEL